MNSAMDELELNLMFLKSWFGDEPDQRERREAIEYLLSHAGQAYPRILAELEARPRALDAPALIQVLPLFRREESVGVLEKILASGDERVCRAAGEALGREPSERALPVLLAGLESGARETRIGAAIGLGVRRDRSACAALERRLAPAEAVERHYLVQAMAEIGCRNEALWEQLEADPDADIRAVALKRKEEEP